jgi:hypothetical protein
MSQAANSIHKGLEEAVAYAKGRGAKNATAFTCRSTST